MRKIALVVGLISAFLLMLPAQALTAGASAQSQPAATGQTPADQKKEDIRRLLDLLGTKKLMVSSMEGMMTSMRPILENSLPAGEYRQQLVDFFIAKFKAKLDVEHLVDAAVVVYDKHFSHEEIKQLITFYQTPVGQKIASALPQITDEMRTEGESWGKRLGQDSMREVLQEHPDLAEAMQAAAARLQVK